MIYAYIYGAKKGLLIGLLYGLLQAVQDPWLIHPAQFMLDYPIAFSCITLAGVVSDTINSASKPYLTFTLGAVASGVFRYVCHVISGMFAFGAYAPSGTTNFFAFSLVYNSYVFIDILLVIVAGFIVFTSKSFVRETQKLSLK
jgi:thiamine transporter